MQETPPHRPQLVKEAALVLRENRQFRLDPNEEKLMRLLVALDRFIELLREERCQELPADQSCPSLNSKNHEVR